MFDKHCFICRLGIKVPNWKVRSYRNRAANKHFFCSRRCFVTYWKQHRVCIRGNGIDGTCEWCKQKFHRRKKNDRIEKFCSSKCFGKWLEGRYIGEKNPHWKGGKKPEPERHRIKYLRWRDAIIRRDKECNICGTKRFLQAHHVQSWLKAPKLRYKLSNGITLCRVCHGRNPNYNPVTTSPKGGRSK